jgi:hypothetical protein
MTTKQLKRLQLHQLQLVTRRQAEKLARLGFDWECEYSYAEAEVVLLGGRTNTYHRDAGYVSRFTAPAVAHALKWVRDEKGLFGCVDFAIANFRKGYFYNYFSFSNKNITGKGKELFGEYEAAESALLDELLTLLEKEAAQ